MHVSSPTSTLRSHAPDVAEDLGARYNMWMAARRQFKLSGWCVASAAVVVLCLQFASPVISADGPGSPPCSRLESQAESALSEASSAPDTEIAVFYPRPRPCSSLSLCRTSPSAYVAESCSPSGASFAALTQEHLSQFTWWKHQRCLCQTLDTPPPFLTF